MNNRWEVGGSAGKVAINTRAMQLIPISLWRGTPPSGRRRIEKVRVKSEPMATRAKRASAPRHNAALSRFPRIMNKKGMEMWQLVFLILALLLFFFALAWYGGLNTQLGDLFAKWNEVF